ncbi:MAG TPA: transcription-repair coupling factor [Candidatus Tenderia sp.]|nr:transcription-repair coupling factor [Candidatus Tenderia sp.]
MQAAPPCAKIAPPSQLHTLRIPMNSVVENQHTPQRQLDNPFKPTLPTRAGEPLRWGRLYGSAFGMVLSQAARGHDGPLVIITADMAMANRLEDELRFYLSASRDEIPVVAFPDWETLPYDIFSPHQDIISQRLEALYRLPDLRKGILVIPAATAMHRLPPRHHIEQHSLMLSLGDQLDLEAFRHKLERSGYRCVSQVMEHGEFAVRGSIIDLFPTGSEAPYRIDLFDVEIETIRVFDPENQRSLHKVESIHLLPAREFPMTDAAITHFRQSFRAIFEGDPQRANVYRDVSDGNASPGIEYYLPLFFDETATLFDYLPAATVVILEEGVEEAAEQFWQESSERYEQRRHDVERPILPPEKIFLSAEALRQHVQPLPQVSCHHFDVEESRTTHNFSTLAAPPVSVAPRAPKPLEALTHFLIEFQGRVLFAAETSGRRESLLELLKRDDLHPKQYSDWQAFLDDDAPLGITVAPLEKGLMLSDPAIAIISESQLFGEQAVQRRRRTKKNKGSDAVVRSLTELMPGNPVVHEDHGVGRYLGLQSLDLNGTTTEFLTLEYAGGDKLYVPVSSLHLISRYTGTSPENAPLHKLGTEQWQNAKRKAAQKATDVAAELLDIYARRAARQGHAYAAPDEQYRAFAAGFPFEETPDQQEAIEAVLADMVSPQPMDRLVCGDVGFGKTEVAMRAAFMAVQEGKQVTVLVPTTLLAQQHYQTFCDRFADWPVRIEVLSRFRSKKEQNQVLAELAEGQVDIIIGTHKLLQSSVKFTELGLVILDEEHRFGVRQKERLKALRAEVDVLTLTATPIPRTLNMALSDLRSLSIIATAPSRRLAIKTFVRQWDKNLVKEACLREIKRGGQVYFLHNEVESIEKKARELEELIPEARVVVAHGQMRERQLEQVMLDFYHQRFNILVCTTIIETGIDVPSANTIIMNRADKLGLAQLYQLRGRVGRSYHQAYAYLIVPPKRSMTADAVKRMEAIESLEGLGAGFTLATHDLEIRGAGELLGDEQSGQIQEVGFSMYSELLERAVKALKEGKEPNLDQPLEQHAEVDLKIPALLPADYLPDVHTRLVLYKRIANAETSDELRELQVEMIDRFGLLPDAAKNLFRVTELKLKAQPLGIKKIDAGPQGGRLIFNTTPNIDPMKIITLIQKEPKTYKLDGQEKLRFIMPLEETDTRIAMVEKVLDRLTGC